jgi:hypothetical protein
MCHPVDFVSAFALFLKSISSSVTLCVLCASVFLFLRTLAITLSV